MEVIRLRKLTGKSILGFGNYSDRSVNQMLSFMSGRKYLRWVYYNSSKISFVDEILDELKIPDDLRFDKPGTNPEKLNELNARFKEQIGDRRTLGDIKFKKYMERRSNAIVNKQFLSKSKLKHNNQKYL